MKHKITLFALLGTTLSFSQDYSGRVGINTETPNATLEVKGSPNDTEVIDGFIFSDTIERNIATSDENIDYNKLNQALEISNLKEFINDLPLGLNTKIGSSGNGISGGQKQRILIARAVYKNPNFILFDEAISALDAENEKIIHDNLQSFFKGRTVIIVAHRLSTVKNADQIIVLKKGQIVEQGNHKELVSKKGEYYNLIKNQLELGA